MIRTAGAAARGLVGAGMSEYRAERVHHAGPGDPAPGAPALKTSGPWPRLRRSAPLTGSRGEERRVCCSRPLAHRSTASRHTRPDHALCARVPVNRQTPSRRDGVIAVASNIRVYDIIQARILSYPDSELKRPTLRAEGRVGRWQESMPPEGGTVLSEGTSRPHPRTRVPP